jgi:protein-tyrosine phosphatase
MSRLYWIEVPAAGRLAIAARPRANDWLEAEVAEWKGCGLDVVVSLLEREEISELGLQHEAETCRAMGIAFISFPIPDRSVPCLQDASVIISSIADGIANGLSIAIHCRAGIGRSSVMTACVLICTGINAGDALKLVRDARGLSVPDTDEQLEWIVEFSKAHHVVEP